MRDQANEDRLLFDAVNHDGTLTDLGPGPDGATSDSGTAPRDAGFPWDVAWPDVIPPWPDAGSNQDATGQVCVDDNYEQNDDLGSAFEIEPGQINAVMCQSDDDFFAFDIEQDQHLRLSLRFSPSVGDLDMALFNGSEIRSPCHKA